MSCPDCFRGETWVGQPSGSESTIHGLRTYIAKPADGAVPRGLIIFITDALGMEFVNNKLLCDAYAKKGQFLVYCPDFMDGHAVDTKIIQLMNSMKTDPAVAAEAGAMMTKWRANTTMEITHPRVVSFLQQIRCSPPPFATDDLKVGVAGFCWGGKHAFLLAHDAPSSRIVRHGDASKQPQALVDCAWTAHPSMLEIPADAKAVQLPLSVVVGGEDVNFTADKQKQVKEILEKDKAGAGHEVIIMTEKGASHGFAVRMDPDDADMVLRAQEAEELALKWFGKWLVA
ncbi:dienelactone hydrolase [Stachybotrys elegans]|uniref:Dienelactone hydrolase n=1 Tax=Stachybotrys elegans TaxID=80388 RepID=A0A8K0WMW1_9HYPO|nr:dienelactone hydrolase [Stachybotrys elegans]